MSNSKDNCVIKQTDTGSLIFGPGAYIDMPHLSSAFFKHGREVNSAVLENDKNSYPPEIDDVLRKVCKDDVRNLVVRTTTNCEVDNYTLARVITKTFCEPEEPATVKKPP